MKLSEMLGWEKKVNYSSMKNSAEYREVEAYNTALESCDREIDREALAKGILKEWTKYDRLNVQMSSKEEATRLAKSIISTMPKWLKPTERK